MEDRESEAEEVGAGEEKGVYTEEQSWDDVKKLVEDPWRTKETMNDLKNGDK